MAGGWRVTARMVATAVAARAVTRAAESVRKLLDEAAPRPELTAPAAPASHLTPVNHFTATTGMPAAPPADDRIIAAQAGPPHEFGPIPLIAPSHGIGFRSEPKRREPANEMPVISRPSRDEPEDRPDVAPAAPVIMPDAVRTAAAFVRDLDDTDGNDEQEVDAPEASEPAEPVSNEASAEEPQTAAEPDEPPVDEQVEEPAPAPVRVLRLTDPPYDDDPTPQPTPVDELVEPPGPDPRPEPEPRPEPDPRPEPEPAVVEPQPAPPLGKKSGKAKGRDKDRKKSKKTKDEHKGKHRRHTSAVSGTVQSSRGRGLRGMQVMVVDDKERVIGTAVSGAGGVFVVEDLPAGSYRLTAADESEGDFATGWHGGSTFAKADPVKVKQGRTRRKIGVTLVSAAAIDLDLDIRKKKAIVGIEVTDRGTGAPAEGSVRVTTKLFSAELPLARGRAAITLFGSAKGSPTLSKKVTVDYSGSKHTRPESASAKLR